MTSIYNEYKISERGLWKAMYRGMEFRFIRMIFGSFIINYTKDLLTPILFGSDSK